MAAKLLQGQQANHTGNELEVFIENRLIREGYQVVPRQRFLASMVLEQPIYSRQFTVAKSVYGTDFKADFILYHPEKWPKCLVIEAKWQEQAGSVDEKYPYLVVNIKTKSPYDTIIVLDGGGYKATALAWLKAQANSKLLAVFNMREFQTWANAHKL